MSQAHTLAVGEESHDAFVGIGSEIESLRISARNRIQPTLTFAVLESRNLPWEGIRPPTVTSGVIARGFPPWISSK